MPIKVSSDKWSVDTTSGRALIVIKEDGVHVQCVTDKDGRIITHDDKVVEFSQVIDLAENQGRLFQ
jgi:hypothetical protein